MDMSFCLLSIPCTILFKFLITNILFHPKNGPYRTSHFHKGLEIGDKGEVQLGPEFFIHHTISFFFLETRPLLVAYLNKCQVPLLFTIFFSSSSSIQTNTLELAKKGTESMASAATMSFRSSKVRSFGRCSKQIRQQRARLYIIWRCTVLLLCWHD
ncbi:hypothetical protein M9H77_01540 [Catharanthus roseus]|uniref:Uncharacterized protein n=1 Tax=Catharanthus roseus TaxID=4058 RepID=A0ACC0C697_CATRO|nr:hypothetical protein M9H77_01540 [Catharanthus roseus]